MMFPMSKNRIKVWGVNLSVKNAVLQYIKNTNFFVDSIYNYKFATKKPNV